MALSSKILITFSVLFSDADNFLANQPFGFSNFLIITFSPNFSLRIWFAFPIPSINPNSLAFLPDQNSPENNSTPVSFF